MADRGPLPHRRLVAAQRPAACSTPSWTAATTGAPRTSRRSSDVATDPPRAALRWDYAPAPESRDAAPLEPRYDLFIDGAFVAPEDGTAVDDQPGHRGAAGRGRVRRAAGRRPRGRRRARRAARWAALPALERGKYVFRIARLIQERARELAIVESLDGGKPIRESRDVDIPLAAAHFFSYAGWADKLSYALAGRSFRPRGVVGQVVPWNFPLLMAAWKLAPALAAATPRCSSRPRRHR